MDPEVLITRLKPSIVGTGYTLKKKRLDEIIKIAETESLKRQQQNDELDKLKQALETANHDKEQAERRCHDISLKFTDASNALQKERQSNTALKTECDNISSKAKGLQTDYEMKLKAAADKVREKNEQAEQLKHAMEKLVEDHQVQLQQLKADYEETHGRVYNEKARLEHQELIKNLDFVQEAHNKTDKRRKQLEIEITALKDELAKADYDKLDIQDQLCKEREERGIERQDLLDQLDGIKHDDDKMAFKTKCESLSTTLMSIQNEFNSKEETYLKTIGEKDKKLQEITQAMEKLVDDQKVQMNRQHQENKKLLEEVAKKKSLVDQQSAKLIDELNITKNAYNNAEGRLNQLELESTKLNEQLEKMKGENSELEAQFSKKIEEQEVKIHCLLDQLDVIRANELQAKEELAQYKQRVKDTKAQLKEAMSGQSKECIASGDSKK